MSSVITYVTLVLVPVLIVLMVSIAIAEMIEEDLPITRVLTRAAIILLSVLLLNGIIGVILVFSGNV